MSLNSFSFVLYMPFVVLINFVLPRRYRFIWLFLASSFFYLSNDVRYMTALLFCIITTYTTGLLLERFNDYKKRIFLAFCISVNILSLLSFRHSLLKLNFVPIGMSFYTLQAIGYTIDVYRKQITAEKNFLRYAAFISFFPTVTSGPIQRGTDLLQQLREGRDFDYARAHSGLYCLLRGYLLKIVIADRLGSMVNYAYDSYQTMPGATLLWATFLYGIQLYCDFAGYSSLAIGAGKLLGFDIKDNFLQPYFATSVKDFWNRWHISLSSWLRDYVYIPLGGNRKGRFRKYINLMITFLVSGLWHGSGGTFLLWGALHGSYQIIGDAAHKEHSKQKRLVHRMAGIVVTFALVDFAWLFFKADSLEQAFGMIERMLFHFGLREMTYYGSYLLGDTRLNLIFLLIGIVIVFWVDFLHEKNIYIEEIAAYKVNRIIRWIAYIILTLFLLLVIVQNYGQAASTFIYEKF